MHTIPTNSSPDEPQNHTPPSPPSQPRQAQINVCLVLSITLLSMALLSILTVGAVLFFVIGSDDLLATSDSTVVPTSSVSPSSPPAGDVSPYRITAATLGTLTQVRAMEEGDIGGAIYGSNGNYIAIAMGKNILVYDTKTMDIVFTLRGHEHNVNALVFAQSEQSNNIDYLASSGVDEADIRVWDLSSGQQRWQLRGHSGWVRGLACSPNGTMLASAGTDRTVRLWNITTGQPVSIFEAHTDMVSDVAFDSAGKRVVSTSRDGTARVWDIVRMEEITFGAEPLFRVPYINTNEHAPWTTGVAISPNNQLVAIGTTDTNIYLVSLADGVLQQTLSGHTGLVVIRGVAFSSDGTLLASGSIDGTVRLWHVDTATNTFMPHGTLDHKGAQVLGVSWHPHKPLLVTSSDMNGSVMIWDGVTNTIQQQLPLEQGAIATLTYSPDGRILGTGGRTGTQRLYVLPEDHYVTFAGGAATTQSLTFLSNTDVLMATNDDAGSAVVIDLLRQHPPRRMSDFDGHLLSVAHSSDNSSPSGSNGVSDGLLVAAGTANDTISVWEAYRDTTTQRTLTGIGGGVMHVAFLGQANEWIVASNDGSSNTPDTPPTIGMWHMQSGLLYTSISDHTDRITGLAVQPHGTLFATTSEDGTLRVRANESGAVVYQQTASDMQGWFSTVAFSPDGLLLVTGSPDGTMNFWEPTTGQLLHTLQIAGKGVLAIAFRPDGEQIAVSDGAGAIFLFEVVSDSA